jgi:hypothetical protein
MRKILGPKGTVAAGLLAAFISSLSTAGHAQETNVNNGFQLPGVSLPQGTDEVRAADGTSCRSAVGGAGAYVDMGMIGKPNSAVADNNYYGRVVVPLGRAPKRLDCVKLYELEVERLKLELELAKAGLGRAVDPEIDSTQTTALPEDQDEEASTEPKVKAVEEDDTPQVQSSVEPEGEPLVAAEEAIVEEDDGSEIVVSAAAWGKASKVSQFLMADEKPEVKKVVAKDAVVKKAVKKPAAKGIAAKPEPRLKTKKVGKANWADEGWTTDGRDLGDDA